MCNLVERKAAGISYLERSGTGVPLLLLHGIGSNANSFTDLMSELPAGTRVLAWNAPGYSGSRPLQNSWPTAGDYAAALLKFLDVLEIERVVIVGHSLGTLMGGAFAVAHPERVSLLLLASCANGYGLKQGEALLEKLAGRITDLADLGAEKFAEARAPGLVFESAVNPDVVAKVRANMAKVNEHGYAQAVHMLASADLVSCLRNCTVPVRFIIAENDRITPPQQAMSSAAAWSEATGEQPVIERIDGAGHAVYIQKPAEFAAVVMKIVRSGESSDGIK